MSHFAANMRWGLWIAVLVLWPPSLAAGSGFNLSSAGFAQGSTIPVQFTCFGRGLNPPLQFMNLPPHTQSLAILGWDDAPGGLAAIWVVYDLPTKLNGLSQGIPEGGTVQGFKQGKNSYGRVGFSPPCPKGSARHRYYFDLYALDVSSLELAAASGLSEVHAAIKRHKIREAKLLGLYP